jgi:dipeptidyl aminopeptidase/acylaminoacyl peptidase
MGGDVYVNSFQHGILKFDSKNDEFIKLNRKSRYSDWIFSVAGSKVAFLKDVRRNRQYYTNLWIMNTDGSDAQDLTESHKKESPFHDENIGSCLLAPDGSKVAIISYTQVIGGKTHSLWLMETDGKRLEKIDISIPDHHKFRLVAWSRIAQSIFLTAEEKEKKVVPNVKLMIFSALTGEHEVLVENVINFPEIYVSPLKDSMVIRYRTDEDIQNRMGHVAILDMETLEIKDFYTDVNLRVGRMSWSKEGDRIAFSKHNVIGKSVNYKLVVYSISENKIAELDYGAYKYGLGYDWLQDANTLIVSDIIDQEPRLRVLNESLEEERQLIFTGEIKNNWTLWGLDNAVLVQRSRRGGFWRLDLATEEWKKVF